MQKISYLHFRTEPNTMLHGSNVLQWNLYKKGCREFTEEEMVTYYVEGAIVKPERGYMQDL